MAGYYDSTDFKWSSGGDYLIGEDGDFADTTSDTILSLEMDIYDVVNSEIGDWELHPGRAAQLKEFAGRPNTAQTGASIESRLRSALAINRVASMEDVYVRVVPVRYDAILIVLSVDAYATPDNRLESDDPLVVSFLFDLTSGSLAFIERRKVTNYFPVGE